MKPRAAMRRSTGRLAVQPRLEVANPAIQKDRAWIPDVADVFSKKARLLQITKQYCAANRGHDEDAIFSVLERLRQIGKPTLAVIARELVETVKRSVTIDWTVRENVGAQLRVLVKRILRKHGYPPDKQEEATQTVPEQADLLSTEWATS